MTQKYFAVINLSNVSSFDDDVYKLGKSISTVFSDKQSCKIAAINLASKAPGSQFAIMEVVEVFEALQPTIVEKKFNSEGELLNV